MALPLDDAHAPERVSLGELGPGDCGIITAIAPDAAGSVKLVQRLLELGFVRGEAVRVIAEARPGGDPFVVRIGETVLAMRRAEAQPVCIEPDPAHPQR
ncbi:MAG: ferrous iron transport protein A [Gammaproteobacteria bacterium]|nr:ferrous iron transport protein A [Gammaproteobacteria bacterium]